MNEYIYIHKHIYTYVCKEGDICFLLCARQVYGFIEFYAGLGNCSRVHKLAGIPTASLDIMYSTADPGKQNYMDILSNAGMAPLGLMFSGLGASVGDFRWHRHVSFYI